MAGGIYESRPFVFNIKCVIFAFLMIGLYWLAVRFANNNKPNYLLFPLIFIISYVALAWYDFSYQCSDKLYSGQYGIAATFDSIFKPQYRGEEKVTDPEKKLLIDQERVYQRNVYLFHLLLIVPVLAYVGYRLYSRTFTNDAARDWSVVLSVLAFGALVYHGYRFFVPRQTCNIIVSDEEDKNAPSQ